MQNFLFQIIDPATGNEMGNLIILANNADEAYNKACDMVFATLKIKPWR